MQLHWPALIFSTALLALGYGGVAIPALTPDACLNQLCGDMKVSFPFKLANATACPSFSSSFDLDCVSGRLLFTQALVNGSAGSPIPVLDLTNDSLALDVSAFRAGAQIASDGTCQGDGRSLALPSSPSPYVFSDENSLGGFGCGGAALLTADSAETNASSRLNHTDDTAWRCDVVCSGTESSYGCGGNNCCVFPWPSGLFPRRIVYSTVQDIAYEAIVCSSSYAIPFHSAYSDLERQLFGVKLKWALPSNQTTSLAIKQSPEYGCAKYAEISVEQEIPGYRCFCPHGFSGDGYTQGSNCTAIDECVDQECSCHHCRVGQLLIIISTFWGLLLLVIAFIVACFCCRMMRRKRCRNETDGLERHSILTVQAIKEESTMLFKEEELNAATDNYSSNMKLGEGGSCSVFKGVLADGRVVAIKKTKKVGNPVHLLNELKIMVKINHKNIARFLGCCLETAEPLLVYEFVANGNVYENLRRDDGKVMNWEQRLKVAAQTADALAYLHGVAVPPILHRDVKSSNVLLDSSFDAKVTDFGVSRLLDEGRAQAQTTLRGTIGYLDPEYFQTFELTEKSDVYSFGVLLAELVTGLKPVDSHSREPRFANLAFLFTHYMRDRASIQDLVDPRLLAHDQSAHTLSSVLDMSALTLQCLSLRSSQRPLMSKVARELARIKHAYSHDLEMISEVSMSVNP